MLKRPARRFHPAPTPHDIKPTSGVLADIIKGFKTEPSRPQKQKSFSIQASEVYVRLLEKNYKEYGVPFEAPEVTELQPPKKRDVQDEPELDFVDKVYVKFNILKSGKVRIALKFDIAYDRIDHSTRPRILQSIMCTKCLTSDMVEQGFASIIYSIQKCRFSHIQAAYKLQVLKRFSWKSVSITFTKQDVFVEVGVVSYERRDSRFSYKCHKFFIYLHKR